MSRVQDRFQPLGNAVDAGIRHHKIIGLQAVLPAKLGAKSGLRLE